MVCFKVRIWILERVRRKKEQGICPRCSREEDGSHILKHEGTKIWGHETLGKSYRKICAEISIKEIVEYKNKEKWQKIEIYFTKHEDKS
jgi:hypothetical protein